MSDYQTEKEYVKNKKMDIIINNKGDAEAWESKWNKSKENWALNFVHALNKKLIKKDKDLVFLENLKHAKYTLIVQVIWIYPGWEAGIVNQPAKLTTRIKLVETNDRSKHLFKAHCEKMNSNESYAVFDDGLRIGNCFEKSGKSIARLLVKDAF